MDHTHSFKNDVVAGACTPSESGWLARGQVEGPALNIETTEYLWNEGSKWADMCNLVPLLDAESGQPVEQEDEQGRLVFTLVPHRKLSYAPVIPRHIRTGAVVLA